MNYFKVINEPTLRRDQLNFISSLFDVANSVQELFSEIIRYGPDMFSMTLRRFLVSELHLFRRGLSRVTTKRFEFLDRREVPLNDRLCDAFDEKFGRVTRHRNVLQHFEDYLFPTGKLKSASQPELDRVGAPIRLISGGKCYVYGSQFGDLFCSLDRTGKIQDVYMGIRFPSYVDDILDLLCNGISSSGVLVIEHLNSLNRDEVRTLKNINQGRVTFEG